MTLAERAAAVGIASATLVQLAATDRRICASIVNADSGARLRRWLEASQPTVDVSRLEFEGDDSVRAVLIDAILRAPTPVAWHAVEHVAWFEVGRTAGAWSAIAPILRAPAGDQPHVIALCGSAPDDEIAGFAMHELAHSWTRSAIITMRTVALPPNTATLESKLAAGVSRDHLVRARLAEEQLADNLAALWGSPVRRQVTDPARGLRRELAAITEQEIEGAA